MNRLMQGDVGSGKRIAISTAISVSNKFKLQLAPRRFLLISTIDLSKSTQIRLKYHALLVGGMPAKEEIRLSGLKNHKIDIVIGTHALIQKDIEFNS